MDRPREKVATKIVKLYVTLEEVCNGSIRQVPVKKNIICPQHSLPICNQCNGRIIVEIEEKFAVVIKKGILDGTEIFRLGEGDEELNKLAGDLIFVVKYLENDEFQYKPLMNLVYKVTIPLHQSFGCWPIDIKVRTPNIGSNLHLTTAHTKGQIIRNGQKMCIPNEGVPDYFHTAKDPEKRGKLIVEFDVRWPKTLSPEKVRKINVLFNMESPVDPNDIQLEYLLEQLSPEEEHLNLGEFFPDSYYGPQPYEISVLKKIQNVFTWFTWSKTGKVPPKTSTITRSNSDVSDATEAEDGCQLNPVTNPKVQDVSVATSSNFNPNAEENCHLNPVTNPKVQVVSEVTRSIPTPNAEKNVNWYCRLNELKPGISKFKKSNIWEDTERYYLNRTDDEKCPANPAFNPTTRTSRT